jgi:O-antigen/teichoic acid export membrane protein
MSLNKKTSGGFIWTFIDNIVLKGFYFISQLILANLLGPEVFGLMLPLAFFYALGNVILDSGLSSSLIRKEKIDNKDLNTLFIVNIVFAIFLYVIFYATAPIIMQIYKQPMLIDIIRVYCIGFLISGFTSVQSAILVRELSFKKITIINGIASLIGAIIGVILGYNGFGIWSLVYMYLITQSIISVFVWLSTKWNPNFEFSTIHFKEHFNYGYKLTFSGILNIVVGNIYAPIIAKFNSLETSGFYERAYNLNQYPVSVIASVISKVTFPIMAKIQYRKKILSLYYKNIIRMSFFITAPLMMFAAALARPIFEVILNPDWYPAIFYFQLFCIASILYPIQLFNVNILKVTGKTSIFLMIEIIKKVVTLIVLAYSYNKGIEFIIIGFVVSSYIEFIINSYFCGREIKYSTFNQILDLVPVFLLTLFSTFLVFILDFLLKDYDLALLTIILGFLFGTIIYLVLAYLFKFKEVIIITKSLKLYFNK